MSSQWFFALILTFISSFAAAQTFDPSCLPGGAKKQSADELKGEINNFLARKGVSPFHVACRGENDMNNPLSTGIGKLGMPSMDSNGNLGKDFFLAVLEKIENFGQENIQMAENLEKCLTTKNAGPQCDVAKTWTDVELPAYVAEARYHLSLASNVDSVGSNDLYFPNSRLRTLRSYKAEDWQKLDPDEIAKANGVLKDYMAKAREITHEQKDGAGIIERTNFLDSKIREPRFAHLVRYRKMIGELPLLNYIHSPKPTRGEVAAAAVKVKFNAKAELEKIKKLKEELIRNPRVLMTDLLYTMNYSSQVEEVLLENPKWCVIGAAALETKGNREIAGAIALTLPLLAASFLAPPIAIPVGAAAGAGIALDAHNEYKETQQRLLSSVYSDNGEADNNELRMSRKNRNMAVVMAPFGAGIRPAAAAMRAKTLALKTTKILSASK